METEKNDLPKELGKDRKIILSSKMYKTAVASFIIGGIIFLSACGYSIFSALHYRNYQAEIQEMQEANQLQQEQLLTLSKKATTLSEELQNLTQMETELRIQAGVKPPKDVEEKKAAEAQAQAEVEAANESAESQQVAETQPTEESVDQHDGQGGPIEDLKLSDVEEALAIIEGDMLKRRTSLEELQADLKSQREQMAVMISMNNAANFSNSTAAALAASGQLSTNAFAFGTSTVGSTIPSIWPTTGVVTSPYGLRWGGSDFHPGIDIANDLGTPIVATADGVVEYAGWNSGGYGNMVDINHGNGLMTRYGHGSQVVVSTGQYVKRGQVIMLMGSTGFSTGPHVHYEVHVNGQRVNPISYL